MTKPASRLLAAALLGTSAIFGSLAPSVASAQAYATPQQAKYAAIVVDAASGEVLYARRADSPRYPASITKVMTLYLVFEQMAAGKLSGDDMVTMSPRAAAQPPSKLGIRAGDSITVNEAISALAVNSANDVSVALAEKIGGTEQRFAAMMTLRAQELGMTNTRFTNAHGLPDSRQLSSARDIAILSRAVMRDFPQYYGRFGQRHFAFRGRGAHRNHNGLLHRMPGVDGIKTGYTNAAGSNLAASAVRDGKRLIAVMLGGNSSAARDAHVADLLNAGFSVMARRNRGETISMASMFHGGSDSTIQLAASRGSVEQGDAGDRPVQLALADGKIGRQLQAAAEAEEAAENARKKEARLLAKAEEDRKRKEKADAIALAAAETKAARDKLKKEQAKETELAEAKAKKDKAEAAKETELAEAKAKKDKAKKADAVELASAKSKSAKIKAAAKEVEVAMNQSGGWVVQVGAFKSESDAKDRLSEVKKAFKGRSSAVTEASGGQYRARFHGFTSEDAKAACKKVSGPCMAVKA